MSAQNQNNPGLTQFTGSGISIGTLTSSAAITTATLNNYNIQQDATRIATDIGTITGSIGTEGNSFQKNVNMYLHQRQEQIITYSHKLNGYDYVYIKPSDLQLIGPLSIGFEKHPSGTIIPSGRGAFAEFRIPKNSMMITGKLPHLKIDAELSASAGYIAKAQYKIAATSQHKFTSKLTKVQLQAGNYGETELVMAGNTFNDSTGIIKQSAAMNALVSGKDSQHFLFIIPAAPSIPLQSEKIFYGARIPIRMQ